MKLLIDFFPLILFFVAFKVWGIYVATGVAIVATILQIAYLRFKNGRVEPMQWISLVVITLFGGATLLAQSDTFIKWKPTVLYWLMGLALVLGPLFFKRNFIKTMMGGQMEMPEPAWRALNWAWAGFLAFMGVLNLWVAYTFSTDAWVNFKLFGGMGLMLAFVLAQAVFLGRYIKDNETGQGPQQ